MSKSPPKIVHPSITETAFNCPHCGALAKQTWFSLKADEADNKNAIPQRITEGSFDQNAIARLQDPEERERVSAWVAKMVAGEPFVKFSRNALYQSWDIYNANLSRCFNCDKIAIWVGLEMVYPARGDVPLPNPDIPDQIRTDFEEAARIVSLSPRGAAALLRLAIQKLCRHLGETDLTIDQNIKSLVEKGLDRRIQQALDIVRVIGNEAVHPGQLDIRDDVDTANKLFGLVNLIADVMISQPKHVEELYRSLPPNKLAGIEARDKRNLSPPKMEKE